MPPKKRGKGDPTSGLDPKASRISPHYSSSHSGSHSRDHSKVAKGRRDHSDSESGSSSPNRSRDPSRERRRAPSPDRSQSSSNRASAVQYSRLGNTRKEQEDPQHIPRQSRQDEATTTPGHTQLPRQTARSGFAISDIIDKPPETQSSQSGKTPRGYEESQRTPMQASQNKAKTSTSGNTQPPKQTTRSGYSI